MIMLATLIRWDWFKLMRRWMPWILLVILLLLSQLTVWGSYFQYRNLQQTGGSVTVGTGGSQRDVNCRDVLAGDLPSCRPEQTPRSSRACRLIVARLPTRSPTGFNSSTTASRSPGVFQTASARRSRLASSSSPFLPPRSLVLNMAGEPYVQPWFEALAGDRISQPSCCCWPSGGWRARTPGGCDGHQ